MSKFLELNEKNDWVESKIWVRVIINKINDYFENNDNKAINNLNISGKWGIGKTTIAYNVKSKLNKDIKCKLFSLWEYEIDSNPYLKILINLINFLDIKINQDIVEKLKVTLSAGFSLFGFFNIDISGKKEESQTKDSIINNKLMEDNDINGLINLINEKTKNSKYVIILDELDRCAPNKISEFLSIIKNLFFKLKNIYFIVCTNNEIINSILGNNYFNNYEEEKYTDKIFEQSIDLNVVLNFRNLPELIKSNILIISFIKKMKLTDLRLINKIYETISKWKSDLINKYVSIYNFKDEKRYKNIDIESDVKYFYLFFFYFIKFYNPPNFRKLIEKIFNYSFLENKKVVEAKEFEKLGLVFPKPNITSDNKIFNQNIEHIVYIKPSNFLTVIDEKEKRISGVIFDFLTQERKYFLKFNFKMEEEEYFYLWLNSNDFEQIKEEQVLNQENKIFLEILKSTKYLLWNIDFENFKKIIIENILLENY